MAKQFKKTDLLSAIIETTQKAAALYNEGKSEEAKAKMPELMDLAYTWQDTKDDTTEEVSVISGVGKLFDDSTELGKAFLGIDAALNTEASDETKAAIVGGFSALAEIYEAAKADGNEDEDEDDKKPKKPEEERPYGAWGSGDKGDENGEGGSETGDGDGNDGNDGDISSTSGSEVEPSKGWGNDMAAQRKREKSDERERRAAQAQLQKTQNAANREPRKSFSWNDVRKGEIPS